jgi:KDO2-lipid IV(A) lauroyltransferase
LSPALGFGANVVSGDRRDMITRHLRRADPTLRGTRLRRAVQESFDSYARYWLESFRLPYLTASAVDRGMRTEGYEHIPEGLAKGNGVILALPHLGGWEWAGRWLADLGHGLTVVVERLDPPELFDWFADLRSKLGMKVVPLGPSAGREVIAALKRNDIVCLLCDRDIQRNGIEVEFFGHPAGTFKSLAIIALATRAPVLPAVAWREPAGTHVLRFEEALPLVECADPGDEIRRNTRAYNAVLERLVLRHPEQWWWVHRRWKPMRRRTKPPS